MIWIIIGFIVLIAGILAFVYAPSIFLMPGGIIIAVIWLIIVIGIFEYAKQFDPWYDSIAISVGEIAAGIGVIYVWVTKSLSDLDRRFEEFKTHQKEIFDRFEKHIEYKIENPKIKS